MPVVGLLDQRSPDAFVDCLRGFRQGLKETGYVEGENIAIKYRWADNQIDLLPAQTRPFQREPVMDLNLQVAKLTAFIAFAALSQNLFSSTGAAQTARVEVHPIKTITLTDQQFLNGAKDGPEIIIGAEFSVRHN
jgi:hypothetical protein